MDSACQNVTVHFFAGLRDVFGPEAEVDLALAPDVAHLLDVLCDSSARERELRVESGGLRKDIVLLVNGRNEFFLGGIETCLEEGDGVDIFPPVFGG